MHAPCPAAAVRIGRRLPPTSEVRHLRNETAVVARDLDLDVSGPAAVVGVLDRVRTGLADGEQQVVLLTGVEALLLQPAAERRARVPQLLGPGGEGPVEAA